MYGEENQSMNQTSGPTQPAARCAVAFLYPCRAILPALLLPLLLLAASARAAVVGPAGYTNDFSVQPAAADWATWSRAGGANDNYVPDTDVNSIITAGGVVLQTAVGAASPANQLTNALWSSPGQYLQTRPTGNRFTTLMAKFVNGSGTNASEIGISYLTAMLGAAAPEDAGLGERVYFSLSGALNSWTNLASLNSTSTNLSGVLATNLAINWTNGGSLYLLWIDDNASGLTADMAYQIDNFSLRINAGLPPVLAAFINTPASNSLHVSTAPVTATATAVYGTPPHSIEYFTNSGAGNTVFASAGSSGTAPFTVALGNLTAGTYNIYAVVTDAQPSSATSFTNTFFVADPMSFTLNAPADGASLDEAVSVTASASVAGGTAPYSVQFHLDNVPAGPPVTSAPYERNFGTLFVGTHTVKAVVTDAKGWVSNSAISTIHITGALGVTGTPTNGATFIHGENVILTAAPGGGTAPYSVAFHTNGVSVGMVSAAPFATNVGILEPGVYTTYAVATDSSLPAPHEAASSTNTFTVLPNPIVVTVTNPTNGQSAVAGLSFTFAASASVSAPPTVVRVEFFLNGLPVGVDSNAPFTATVSSPVAGTQLVYAVATDSLGRTGYSPTNTVVFIVDPLVNNNFANRIELGTPAHVTGNNTGAGTEGGEPTSQFGGGVFIQWGATLWYKWTAPFRGSVTIDTLGSEFDTVLSVYTGTAVNGLTLVQRNNDFGGTSGSLVSFAVTAGTEYQIQVGGWRPFGPGTVAQTGAFQLNLAMPPSVTITSPAPGTVILAGSNFTVEATAATAVGSITNVSLYRGGTLVGAVTAPPYSWVVNNAPAGSNALFAVAIDNLGQVSTSAVVTVAVFNLGLTLTAPLDNATFLTTNPITLGAYALLGAGTMTNVEFFVDDVKVAEATNAPFVAAWANPPGGSHRVHAVGRADDGATYLSQLAFIGVGHRLVVSNSVWLFRDDGSDQGTNWIALDADVSGWGSGPAPLGYSDSNGRQVLTTNNFGPDSNNKFPTTYYRQTFNVSGIASLTNVILNVQRDDGVVIYLNGAELTRNNMPAGPVTYTTFASANAADDGGTTFTLNLDPTLLVEGTNVVAAEVHQDSANSSDIWFVMEVIGVPAIIRNLPPVVSLIEPTNAVFVGPVSLQLVATASDPDGVMIRVDFFDNGTKIGEVLGTGPDFAFTWTNPPVGTHSLTAVGVDDLGGRGFSAALTNTIYDAEGRPYARVTWPAYGSRIQGPTNLLVTAFATAIDAVTNVEFYTNGVFFGSDAEAPFAAWWTTDFGTNELVVVAEGANGLRGTSTVSLAVITMPPTNTVAPYIIAKNPPAFTGVTNMTSITVVFSEPVQGVDAGDMLINGVPATGLIGVAGMSNYTFTFPEPPYGEVEVAFAAGHGITDYGWPTLLPLDELDPSAAWEYEQLDRVPPVLVSRSPAPGVTVSNLFTVSVGFSEAVVGVNPEDLLVSGTAAYAVTNLDNTNFIFFVSQPLSGTVTVNWAASPGIVDTGSNAFVPESWSFVLDARTLIFGSNTVWRWRPATNEASTPSNLWRFASGFSDADWSNAPAPFFYNDPYTNVALGIFGTRLTGMRSNYTCIFLRKEFVLSTVSPVQGLFLHAQSDDGFIAWINGVEALRVNVPAGDPAYNSRALSAITESAGGGAPYNLYTLSNFWAAVNGTNVLAIQAFNLNLNDADFGFNAQLSGTYSDTATTAPQVRSNSPPSGDIFHLTNLVVTFSEAVTNVDAADLLINGVPASAVATADGVAWDFTFPQPPYGPVTVVWNAGHGIVDFDNPPRPFNASAANATFQYLLINPSAPVIVAKLPAASTTVTSLTSIAITFSEPVTGVDAADLRLNGVPATGLSSASPSNHVFTFPQPPFGNIAVTWAGGHGIKDLEPEANAFDPSRPGHTWSYLLVDPVPSVAITNPANFSYVLAGTVVTIRARATDNDGVIERVGFYADANLLGETTNAPYTFIWSNMPVASYTLRAVAVDNTGIYATSAPVVLNIVSNLPVVLTRGPYLQSLSSTGTVVRWRTDGASDAVVRYGTAPDSLTNIAVQAFSTNEHIVSVPGLSPSSTYYYSIGSSEQLLAGGAIDGTNFWFKTSPVAGTRGPTRIWALGDSGTANANQIAVRDAFYNFAATNGRMSDLWLMLGDNAYNSGTDTEYQNAVFNMYPATLRNYCLWPTIGNHESAQSTSTTISYPYLDIFSLPQNAEAGGVPSGSLKYYSFDYANIHFVCLDSMTSGRTATTPMAQWLTNDLANNVQEWTVVFFHHPPYTKGSHNSDTESDLIAIRQNLMPLLEAAHVDLVLCGHSHSYERSYLLNGHYGLSTTLTAGMKINPGNGRADGDGAYSKNPQGDGVVYTVAGSSGQISGGTLNHPAHFFSINELGSLVIDVVSNRLDMMFLNSTGDTRDRVTLIKLAPAAPTGLVAAGVSSTQIDLAWNDVATNELSYLVERSLDGTNFTFALSAPANSTNASDIGLIPDTGYFYRVRAVNAVGASDWSDIASASTTNGAPIIAAISDAIVNAGGALIFTNTVTDPDAGSQFTWALDPAFPPSAVLNPTNGIFMWIPRREHAGTTNSITVRVTDNGVPPLSATRTFTVIVRDQVELGLDAQALRAGTRSNILFTARSTARLTNFTVTVQFPAERLVDFAAENLTPALGTITLDTNVPGAGVLAFNSLPGLVLADGGPMARLHFSAVAGQSSAFVPLHLAGPVVMRAEEGLAPTVVSKDGRAVVIADRGLLEASAGTNGTRLLTLYGIPGVSYTIETSPTPTIPASWAFWQTYMPTNIEAVLVLPAPAGPSIFYRARQ